MGAILNVYRACFWVFSHSQYDWHAYSFQSNRVKYAGYGRYGKMGL